MLLLLWLLLSGPVAAHSIADLRQAERAPALPEPTAGKGCPVPPIPDGPRYVEGEGYSIDRLTAWRNFNLNGMRYYIEYQVVKRSENGGVVTRPFPSLYMLDVNRDGVFNIPGEAWRDTQGNGRCADLEPLPAPVEGEARKPLA